MGSVGVNDLAGDGSRRPAAPASADRVTRDYLRGCAGDDRLRTAVEDARLPPALFASAGQRLLPRPLFVETSRVHDFAAALARLFDLITSLPERLFGGDLDRYCAVLGIDARRGRLMRRLGGGAPPLYGRADMYDDGASFKLLEFNIASELGGVDRAGEIPRALLEREAFAAFAGRHRLTYTHTGREVARVLRAVGETVARDGEPRVALLEGPGGMAEYGAYWRSFAELMRGLGLDFHAGEVGEIRTRGGRLWLGDGPIDVILRCFSVDQICAVPDGEALVEPIFRAHEAGTVALWTPMESNLFGNKGCLALLSGARRHGVFTDEELALIDRVLPWTRALGPRGADRELMDACRERRTELILKPNGGYGGAGIVAGWEADEREWRRALSDAAAAGCVVQERVIPRREPVVDPHTGAVAPWQAVWGLFLTPYGFAGAYARALPAWDSAVIGIGANPRTRTAGVFLTDA